MVGQKELIKLLPPKSNFMWYGDNAGALFASRRELSTLWKVNGELGKLSELKKEKQVVAQFAYVKSEENPADALSRKCRDVVNRREACELHRGEYCECFKEWVRKCGERVRKGEEEM